MRLFRTERRQQLIDPSISDTSTCVEIIDALKGLGITFTKRALQRVGDNKHELLFAYDCALRLREYTEYPCSVLRVAGAARRAEIDAGDFVAGEYAPRTDALCAAVQRAYRL